MKIRQNRSLSKSENFSDQVPRRIKFVAPRFHTNQIGLVKFLQSRGCDVSFDVMLRGHTEDHSALQPVLFQQSAVSRLIEKLLGSGGKNSPRSFPSLVRYYKWLSQESPDLLIIRSPRRYFSFLAAVCAKAQGRKILFYDQSTVYRRYSLVRRIYIKILLWIFNAAWFSPVEGEKNEENGKPQFLEYLPFVVDRHALNPVPIKKEIKILSVGKFQKRKNQVLLIDVVRQLADQFDFSLSLVGECITADQKKVRDWVAEQIRKNNLQHRIEIVTNVPHSSMPEIYAQADLFVLPAEREAASIAVVEALAAGVPTICSSTCGTRWYIHNEVMGRVFECGSESSLGQAISEMLGEIRRNQRYKEAVYNAFWQRNDEANFAGKFQQLLVERWGQNWIIASRGRS